MIEHPPNAPQTESHLPYDFEQMVVNFGDRRITEKILISYADQLKGQLLQLQSAIAEGEEREVHRIAHSIRGGAQNLYNSSLRDAANHLECAAKTGMKHQPVQRFYSILEREVLFIAESVSYHHSKEST